MVTDTNNSLPPPIYETTPDVDIDFSFLVSNQENKRYPLLQGRYGIFDFEWSASNNTTVITCATFSDNFGNKISKHILDFNTESPERDLLLWINSQIKSYVLTFGWASTEAKSKKGAGIDSDLAILDTRCRYHGTASLVKIITTNNGNRYATINDYNHVHLDVCKMVSNEIMMGVNKDHGIIYNSNTLNDVSEAYFGVGKGKLEGLTGVDIEKESKEKQIKYNAHDVDLTRKILQHDNYEILDLYYMISKVAKLKFNVACHRGATTYWQSIIDNTSYKLPTGIYRINYQGTLVFDPEQSKTIGDYKNIYSVDFNSLYPNCKFR
jgi:hypothetical protein